MNEDTQQLLALKQAKEVARLVRERVQIKEQFEQILALSDQVEELIEGTATKADEGYNATQLQQRSATLQTLLQSKQHLAEHQPQIQQQLNEANQQLLKAQFKLDKLNRQ